MPPKRGKANGSPEKVPMQSSTKRTRRDDSQPSQSTPGARSKFPSHYNVDNILSVIVDCNETTPLPSPQSGDEQSALMGHMSPPFEAPNLEGASMLPASEGHASSPASTSAATNSERATSKEVGASQQQVGDSKSSASAGVNPHSDVLTIHNGESDSKK
uniref:Uncharacterized protein n=1 Tax=Peronospora matthiolae TaxID=2874970 RepID=A0AAV1TGM3_9STRA